MDRFSLARAQFWRIPVDARLGGGGCREENRPQAQTVYIMCKLALTRGHTPLLYSEYVGTSWLSRILGSTCSVGRERRSIFVRKDRELM